MKITLPFLLFLFLSLCSGAQDTIVFRSGEKILGKVVKITPHTIEYQRADVPDGPVYSKDFNTVAMVLYANGKSEVFALPSPREYRPREDSRDRHRDVRNSMKNPQRVKTQGIIMTAIGTTLLTGGAATLVYGLTAIDFVPTVIGAIVTSAGIPFTIIGSVKISRAKREVNKRKPVNFDSEIGFKPIASPAYGALGYRAGVGISWKF